MWSGCPDPQTGEAIHAFVVPAGDEVPDRDGTVALVRATLSANSVPRTVTVIREVPVNAAREARQARRCSIEPGRPRMRDFHVVALSDESLIAGMASGDAAAVAALVRRYQARVYGLALRVIDDSGLAEEVAQDAFMRAWRYARPATTPRRGRVDTWLLTITRNLVVDAVRLRRDHPVDPERLMVALVTETDRARVRAGSSTCGPACGRCRPSRRGRSCWPRSTG